MFWEDPSLPHLAVSVVQTVPVTHEDWPEGDIVTGAAVCTLVETTNNTFGDEKRRLFTKPCLQSTRLRS